MKLFMTIDFIDNLIPIAWDRERIRQFVNLLAGIGVKRIYWVFHGNREDGFWDNTGLPWQDNLDRTFAAVGNSDLKAAAEISHAAGMEIFAVYKPFDLAIQSYSLRGVSSRNKITSVGDALQLAFNFPAAHREALMARRSKESVPAARILLKSANKLAENHCFRLWKSTDNRTYRMTGQLATPEPDGCRVIFDIAGEDSEFFAIESLAPEPAANRLDTIIEVRAPDGRPVQHSLGLAPRKYRKQQQQKNHLKPEFDSGAGFASEGFFFDYLPGIPSAVSRGEYLAKTFSLADNGQNVIGVSLKINGYVPGAPEPAEPTAVEYWLGMIVKAIDCGVDGVDIRITNHNSIIEWGEYGFNRPLTDEFIKRYGTDPRCGNFEKEKLRRLRGEYYTAFLEKAAALVKNSACRFAVHIPTTAFGSPAEPTMMEIHWDWRQWLTEGIPDEVTYKVIHTADTFSPEGCELLESCRNGNIPATVCPFIHALPDPAAYLAEIENSGARAFNCYEAATLWDAVPDGFKELRPAIINLLKSKFTIS
ncbi:MAG: hypothetical protein PHV82_03980 [Victivallaceae bacterium]|nr:hypothetical protein [Victivallaceae bacterium]